MKLALFDLDHTLLPLDSDQSWGEFTLSLGWVDPDTFQAKNNGFSADYLAGCLDTHAYVRRLLRRLSCGLFGHPRLRALFHRCGA